MHYVKPHAQFIPQSSLDLQQSGTFKLDVDCGAIFIQPSFQPALPVRALLGAGLSTRKFLAPMLPGRALWPKLKMSQFVYTHALDSSHAPSSSSCRYQYHRALPDITTTNQPASNKPQPAPEIMRGGPGRTRKSLRSPQS